MLPFGQSFREGTGKNAQTGQWFLVIFTLASYPGHTFPSEYVAWVRGYIYIYLASYPGHVFIFVEGAEKILVFFH